MKLILGIVVMGMLVAAASPVVGDDLIPEDVIPPLPGGQCDLKTVGNQVGYINDIQKSSLASDIWFASDPYYLAYGVFSGGSTLDAGGLTYHVYTILSGVSVKADWCN